MKQLLIVLFILNVSISKSQQVPNFFNSNQEEDVILNCRENKIKKFKINYFSNIPFRITLKESYIYEFVNDSVFKQIYNEDTSLYIINHGIISLIENRKNNYYLFNDSSNVKNTKWFTIEKSDTTLQYLFTTIKDSLNREILSIGWSYGSMGSWKEETYYNKSDTIKKISYRYFNEKNIWKIDKIEVQIKRVTKKPDKIITKSKIIYYLMFDEFNKHIENYEEYYSNEKEAYTYYSNSNLIRMIERKRRIYPIKNPPKYRLIPRKVYDKLTVDIIK